MSQTEFHVLWYPGDASGTTKRGLCGGRVFGPGGGPLTIVCSQPPADSGYERPSLIDNVGRVAAELVCRLPALREAVRETQAGPAGRPTDRPAEPFRFVVHHPCGREERERGIEETFALVRFASYEPTSEAGPDGLRYRALGAAERERADRTQVEAMAAAEFASIPLKGASVAIQGFGAVGSAAAERLVELGATVTAVSTVGGRARA